jgi:hypothetical protein
VRARVCVLVSFGTEQGPRRPQVARPGCGTPDSDGLARVAALAVAFHNIGVQVLYIYIYMAWRLAFHWCFFSLLPPFL